MHRGLERAAERHGNRVAIRFEDTDWTWRELDAASNAFARHLRGSVNKGDRVAIMDGGRGTGLQAMGVPMDGEAWGGSRT